MRLLASHLVVSLKAALTSQDQDKIGYAIQEVLKLLNEMRDSSDDDHEISRESMVEWLRAKLEEKEVLQIVEPFWSTSYNQQSVSQTPDPPFFDKNGTYKRWISTWCRYLIEKSSKNPRSRWKKLFETCISAVRAEAGLNVAEFLLPLLILDILCFGDDEDEGHVVQEIALVFDVCCAGLAVGGLPAELWGVTCTDDHRRAVNIIFVVIDILEYWANNEIEMEFTKKSRRNVGSSRAQSRSKDGWPTEESIQRIQATTSKIKLQTRADAAIKIGAHARAVRCLEQDARVTAYNERVSFVEQYTGRRVGDVLGPIKQPNVGKMQLLLGRLNDVDGMSSLLKQDETEEKNLIGQIDQMEVIGDWAGALQSYEQAIIMQETRREACPYVEAKMDLEDENEDSDCTRASLNSNQAHSLAIFRNAEAKWKMGKRHYEKGLLRSLLHLGQLESVLNQVGGMINRTSRERDRERERERELELDRDRDDRKLEKNESEDSFQDYLPNAIEAAWRLQKWPLLEDLIRQHDQYETRDMSTPDQGDTGLHTDPESNFQVGVGKAMLGLHKKRRGNVLSALNETRLGLMGHISHAARESYSRSLDLLTKFHVLQEIEQATETLCSGRMEDKRAFLKAAKSSGPGGWDWDGRLEILGRADNSRVINVRLALAKLAGQKALEGNLWLTTARRARKDGIFHIAKPALDHALAMCKSIGEDSYDLLGSVRLQLAKVRQAHEIGSDALQIIESKEVEKMLAQNRKKKEEFDELRCYVAQKEAGGLEGFGTRSLCATQWIVKSNLKRGEEVMTRFKNILMLTETWEKSHFYYAQYCDELLEARISSLIHGIHDKDDKDAISSMVEEAKKASSEDEKRKIYMKHDVSCHNYLKLAIDHYGLALYHGDKHLNQALPRKLTLFFEFTALPVDYEPIKSPAPESETKRRSKGARQVTYSRRGRGSQSTESPQSPPMDLSKNPLTDADRVLGEAICTVILTVKNRAKVMPKHTYYSAMPQLISRITHPNTSTESVVSLILGKVLVAYPKQAMWKLAWLLYSKNEKRKQRAKKIFEYAAKDLHSDTENHGIIKHSHVFFSWLKAIAEDVSAKKGTTFVPLKPLRFSGGVKLSQFVPPVQAALAMNVARRMSAVEKDKRRDGSLAEVFPQYVPRIQKFNNRAEIYQSKAKPKKVRGIAVGMNRDGESSAAVSAIGEFHFLLKIEAKGDLRKDERVQDVNSVLNRLLAQGGDKKYGGGASGGGRRLHLRTYAVTCLSEDCGILEWVPNTANLRMVVKQSVNHQVPVNEDSMRRGTSIGNPQVIAGQFLACQDKFIKHGHLKNATKMFEEKILALYPPVLHWYFVEKYQDCHSWFDARMRFTLSAAVWSAVGHILGLGDRHTENILLDTKSGELLHVDFDCLFNKGWSLTRPEVVPFRLTVNMIDVMGAVGHEGAYKGGLMETLDVLRENRDLLLAVLEPFLLDPVIDFKKHDQSPSKGSKGGKDSKDNKNSKDSKDSKSSSEKDSPKVSKAIMSMKTIEGRLRGIYNITNPNFTKIARTDGGIIHPEDEAQALLPLGVEGQANKLIFEATKSENLVQMFVGWMSWV